MYGMETKKAISLRLDEEVLKKLKEQAEANKSKNYNSYYDRHLNRYQSLANEALKCWLNGKPLPKLQKPIKAVAKGANIKKTKKSPW